MNILSTSADCIARGEEDELEGELQDWSAFPTQALAVGEACLRGGVKDKPVGARAYDVTAVLTFSAAAARGALARGVCLDELSTKHSIRPDF